MHRGDTLRASNRYQGDAPIQRRYFGHPDLVMLSSADLSHRAFGQRNGRTVGDMGSLEFFNGGHASHQTGLDVDIFLQLPKRAGAGQLIAPAGVRSGVRDGKHVVPSRWSSDIASHDQLAAQD